jgi:hypothetical protein
MLGGFLDGREDGTGCFALPGIMRIAVGPIAIRRRLVGLQFIAHFFLQQAEIEVAQGVRAESSRIVGGRLAHAGIFLQHIRDATENGRLHTIGSQRSKQQQRFERCIGCQVGRRRHSTPPAASAAGVSVTEVEMIDRGWGGQRGEIGERAVVAPSVDGDGSHRGEGQGKRREGRLGGRHLGEGGI